MKKILIEVLRENAAKATGRNSVIKNELENNWTEIKEAINAGFSRKAIWQAMKNSGSFNGSYGSFLNHIYAQEKMRSAKKPNAKLQLSPQTARRFDMITEKYGLDRRDAVNEAINEWLDRHLVLIEINQADCDRNVMPLENETDDLEKNPA